MKALFVRLRVPLCVIRVADYNARSSFNPSPTLLGQLSLTKSQQTILGSASWMSLRNLKRFAKELQARWKLEPLRILLRAFTSLILSCSIKPNASCSAAECLCHYHQRSSTYCVCSLKVLGTW